MATYTKEPITEYQYPNISIYGCYADKELYAYELNCDEGYKMYNTATESTTIDPETGEEVVDIYYCKKVALPLRADLAALTWVAVKE